MRQQLNFKRSMRLWQPMLTFGLREDILVGKYARHYKSRLTKENKMVDVRLTYDKGLDRYYGLLELAEKYEIFKKVSTRFELPDGSKQFGKTILNEPEKYFTEDIMHQLDLAAETEFKYG